MFKTKPLSSLAVIFLLACLIIIAGCSSYPEPVLAEPPVADLNHSLPLDEAGVYSSPEDVARYIYTYNRLPRNFITKSEAAALGWESQRGNLWEVAESCSIGGDIFHNYEGKLPRAADRIWRECDVNYYGGYRGAGRIVYSNDGLIFYTADHYRSFKQLY